MIDWMLHAIGWAALAFLAVLIVVKGSAAIADNIAGSREE